MGKMTRRMAAAVLALLLALQLMGATSAFADGGAAVSTVKLNQVQQKDAELTMYVTMSDANGYPSTGTYGAGQFFVSIDENTLDVASIEQYDPQTQGVHYVFCIDVSSTLNVDMMAYVQAGLYEFVDAMGPYDTVSIITFGEQVVQRLAGSADHDEIKAVIASISPTENMTALYKGVCDAVQLAGSQEGRSAVVVITDGRNDPTPEMAAYTKDSIRNEVLSAQVPLYCIGLNDGGGVDTESLQEFADLTGGEQYVIGSGDTSASLGRIRDTIRSAIKLHTPLINYSGLSGFNAASTFKVRFEPAEGGYVMSNDLQQNINWTNVPGPESLLLPQIDLQMDDQQVAYGETVTVTGSINVGQGAVASEDLVVTVNGVAWTTEIKRNGTGYTFSASGSVSQDTADLRIRAEIPSLDVASGYQTVTVITPEATPVPVVSVLLDDTRDLTYAPGKTVTLTGEIDVDGEVDPAGMELYVNDAAFPMTLKPIGTNQYSFSADVSIGEDSPKELNVQVQHRDVEVYSRPQILVLADPTGMAKVGLVLRSMVKSGVIWIILGVVAAAAAITAALIWKKKHPEGRIIPTDKVDQKTDAGGASQPPAPPKGTKRITPKSSGTKRITRSGSGTKRISPTFIELRIEETRGGQMFDPRTVNVNANSEVVFGRNLVLMPAEADEKEADVTFDDFTVSAHHMKVSFNGKNLTIEDLGSSNGTDLNGTRLTPSHPSALKSGDTVLIGETTLKIFCGEPEPY